MENEIYFKDSFVEKLIKLIPNNTQKTWRFWSVDFSKIIGGVRYNNDKLESIYLILKSVVSEENHIKFNLVNDYFIFDSIYSYYDPVTKQNFYPCENRYDKDLNIIATYKYDDNLDESSLYMQYKNNEKLKQYYCCVDKFPYKIFEDLVKKNILNRPHWMCVEKKYNILQYIWCKVIKNNKIKNFGISVDCLKVYGNDNLIYYWIK